MDKIHMTPDGPKSCRATKRPCKYGEHFESMAEAEKAFAEKNQANEKFALRKEVDYLKAPIERIPINKLEAEIPAGNYWLIASEDEDSMPTEVEDLLFYQEGEVFKKTEDSIYDESSTFYAHKVNGEAFINTHSNDSGISNCFVSEKLFKWLSKENFINSDNYSDEPFISFDKPVKVSPQYFTADGIYMTVDGEKVKL